MNLKQRDLWCVEIDLPGSLKHPNRAVNWLCYFNSLPTKEIILAAIEVEIYRWGGGDANFYTRLFESVSFWDGVSVRTAQIMVAGTSIGQIEISKPLLYFEVNSHLDRVKT